VIAALSDAAPPPVSGFMESAFSPLVHQAVARALSGRPIDGSRTAIVLASTMGDAASLDLGSRLLVAGQVGNALLFMQSTPNAILGVLSQDFAVTGPLLALSTLDDLAGELLAAAELLLEDDELDTVVLVGVELADNERTAAAHRELGTDPAAGNLAVAIVLDRKDLPPQLTFDDPSASSTRYGGLRGLVELAARIRGAN
jgi:hypothetical protein